MAGDKKRWHRWLKFVSGGLLNTCISYITYLILNLFMTYQLSYLIAYITGIGFSYWFNATYVFRVRLTWSGLFAYPLVYLLQYCVGAILLMIMVEQLGLLETLAPLIVAVTMLPITYIASKTILLYSSAKNNIH